MLGNFACFFDVCLIFSKSTFSKNYFRNTISVSNSLDPDKAQGNKLFMLTHEHWRSSNYTVMHLHIKNSNIQGMSPNVVKVIFHIIRNCF